MCNGSVYLDPSFPVCLNRLRVSLHHRRSDLQIEMMGNHLSVTAASANMESVKVICQGQATDLQPGASITVDLINSDV